MTEVSPVVLPINSLRYWEVVALQAAARLQKTVNTLTGESRG
jgi:hypothetical protein